MSVCDSMHGLIEGGNEPMMMYPTWNGTPLDTTMGEVVTLKPTGLRQSGQADKPWLMMTSPAGRVFGVPVTEFKTESDEDGVTQVSGGGNTFNVMA